MTAFSNEVPMIRDVWMVGGEYLEAETSPGKVMTGQMYVERLLPPTGPTKPYPLIFIHGAAQTGVNWLNKPDGGRGWASCFISQGYEVCLVDIPARGRSPWHPLLDPLQTQAFDAASTGARFTSTANNGRQWPQADKQTQWPGSGQVGDPVFDKFYKTQVQMVSDQEWQQKATQAAGAKLLDRLGKPCIIVGHSAGGPMVPLIADARPHLTKALVLLEPGGPPFVSAFVEDLWERPYGVTTAPLTFDPPVTEPGKDIVTKKVQGTRGWEKLFLQADEPTPRKLINLVDKPILIITGEASYHAPYDHCTAEFYRQAGCGKTDFWRLEEKGIRGNGHMFFMEKNSDEIQLLLRNWIRLLDIN